MFGWGQGVVWKEVPRVCPCGRRLCAIGAMKAKAEIPKTSDAAAIKYATRASVSFRSTPLKVNLHLHAQESPAHAHCDEMAVHVDQPVALRVARLFDVAGAAPLVDVAI